MTSRYETVFILTPVLSEDQAKEAVAKFKALLKDGKAKTHHEEDWAYGSWPIPSRRSLLDSIILLNLNVKVRSYTSLSWHFAVMSA